jgi:hypothetical protein
MKPVPALLVLAAAAALMGGCKPRPAAAPAELLRLEKAPSKTAPSPEAQAAAAAPMLAYSYGFRVRTRADAMQPLMRRHEQACANAGPSLCQVLSSNVETGEGLTSANLKLRAVPSWVARFRSGLDGEARAAGGRVTGTSVDSEDLARSIVDDEAALKAKIMLRTRLEQLLAQRPGKLSELIDLQKALAQAQGEIDATQSELEVMRTRVAMSTVTVDYSADPGVGASAAPLGRAFSGFFGNVLAATAGLVTFLSYALPFLVFGVAILAAVIAVRRRLRKRKQAS